ncbi:transposase [Streptomyces sp. NPDC002054]|uniref:transposase n=1 Tax=Streptomyces sp. NPDC002054 TaxID=3154663 RepID=UPI003332BB17
MSGSTGGRWAQRPAAARGSPVWGHPRHDVEVTRRDPGEKGFKVIPRRWVVERTFGWLMNHRRLARDYETHPHRSEAMIRLAVIDLMSRRLTRESTPNWKDS